MIYDAKTAIRVLGCLFKDPSILANGEKYTLTQDDFALRIHKIIFAALNNMFYDGAENINITDFNDYLKKYPELYKVFEDATGNDIILTAIELADMGNFNHYYERFKKLSLLRSLKDTGFDVSYWYSEDVMDIGKRQEMELQLENSSISDIINYFQGKLSQVESAHNSKKTFVLEEAGKGILDLIKHLEEAPEIGLQLDGEIFTSISRGARKKKVYLVSGDTGTGKSRIGIGNACRLAFPIRWSNLKGKWIKEGSSQKILFISTELEGNEIRTIMLAYLSGVNEEIILNGNGTPEQKERIYTAGKIIQMFSENFLIYEMPDPTVAQLNSHVRKIVITKKIDALFYDYIHSSAQLLSEFAGVRVREDVILLLLTTALKNLANELDIFVWSGTQVNANAADAEFADTSCLRGSRSIADKIDFGSIVRPATPEFLKTIKTILDNSSFTPNMFFDIYKNRRSRYKYVRLWSNVDLGIARMSDCFLTTVAGELIPIDLLFGVDANLTMTVDEILEKLDIKLDELEKIEKKKLDLTKITV